MFAGGLVLSVTIISFAIWMQWNENQQAVGVDKGASEVDRRYIRRRARHRQIVNGLFLFTGLLVLASTFAGVERKLLWLSLWATTIAVLMVIVILAGIDALRTHLYHLHKLPEVRKKALEGKSKTDEST